MKSYNIRQNEITLFFYPEEADDKAPNSVPMLSMPELSILYVKAFIKNSSIKLKLLDFDKNKNCIYLLFDYNIDAKSNSFIYKWKPTIPVLCILPDKYGYEEDEHIAVCGLSVKLHNSKLEIKHKKFVFDGLNRRN